MKFDMRAVFTLLAVFAVFEGTSRLVAQETAPPRRKALNPSQAFPPVTPSQVIDPVNPSQAFPRENPSRVIPPLGPSRENRALPPVDSGGFKQAPSASTLPLTTQVFIAIAEGPNQLRGLPPFGNAGIAARNLRVESDGDRVVLRGSVATEADRALAGVRAEEIAGTGKVVNRLSVSR